MKLENLLSKVYKKKRPIDYFLYLSIIALGIIIDQFTKFLTVAFLEVKESVPLIEGVLHFTYIQNTGAAFGMMKDARWVFMITSTVMITVLSLYLFLGHAENNLYGIATSMIISGGIGNMIDRLTSGYVVDFIDFVLIDFAVFNAADSFVCVGSGLLILALVIDLIAEARSKKNGEKK